MYVEVEFNHVLAICLSVPAKAESPERSDWGAAGVTVGQVAQQITGGDISCTKVASDQPAYRVSGLNLVPF